MPSQLIRIMMACFALLGALSGCANQNYDTECKTIRIAANLPLSGPLASYGQSIKEGAAMAVEDLKRTAPSGPWFRIDWQDNGGDPQKAASIYQQQGKSEYDIYWSGVKPETDAIKDKIDARGMPHFVWIYDSTGEPKTEGIKDIKNSFRIWLNFQFESSLLVNYVKARMAKKIAIVFVEAPNLEEDYKHIFIPALKAIKVDNILIQTHRAQAPDYKSILLNLRAFKPDLIILSGFQANFVGLIRALRSYGLIENGNTICSYDLLEAAKLLRKDELEGIRVVAPLFATDHDSARIKGWSERFYRHTQHQASYTNAFAYDAISIIHDAAKRMILPASSEQWVRALQATNAVGVAGPLAFDSDANLITPAEIGVFKNGIPISEPTSNR